MTSEGIYEKYHRLAWKVARIMQVSYGLQEEDVEDIAMAAIAKLITIPIGKIDGRGLTGYARTVINNAARTELKLILKGMKVLHYEDVWRDDPTGYANGDQADYARTQQDIEDTTQLQESLLIDEDLVSYYLSTLTPDETCVVKMLLGQDGSPPLDIRQIAKRIGETPTYVQQLLSRTYIRMKKRLEA